MESLRRFSCRVTHDLNKLLTPVKPSRRFWPASQPARPNWRSSSSKAQALSLQKMESLRRLACRVTHNLNKLLTPVKEYAGLVLERLRRADPLRGAAGQFLRPLR